MKKIQLTQGKVALIDDADFESASQFKWYAKKHRNTFYVRRNMTLDSGKRVTQCLHQFLIPGQLRIDHADGNGLNNSRSNIRLADAQQNKANSVKLAGCSSRFKGVCWYKPRHLWVAYIKVEYRALSLGYYESESDAAHVYDYAAKIYFGDFARLNFP